MTHNEDELGPGVPEAVSLTLRLLERELGAESMDRLWIFPPLVRGRRERGLMAVSCYDDETRRLYTVAYTAERTGTGIDFEPLLREEGSAPPDRLPRVIDGVVRRSGLESGSPREVRIGGDPLVFEALLSEFDQPEVSPT